jgi:hypothetical protein
VIVHAPLRDLNSEVFFAKLEAKDSEALRDLKSEVFSAKLEVEDSEAVRDLAILLAWEEARLSEPDRDLNSEDLSARPDAMVQLAVRVVEQERGLELQISFPESTLATMLPIVIVIEAARALKIEVFSTKLAAKVREPGRFFKIEVFSTKPAAKVREPLRL